MVTGEISLYFLLGHVFIAGIGSVCVPVQCLKCNITGVTLKECINDFKVEINSTGSEVNEGDEVTLTCAHNLPNMTLELGWTKDGKEMLENKNKSKLVLEKVFSPDAGCYICYVNSSCGNYESSQKCITVNNNSVIILVVCGVSALALILILGLAMKLKLKRDNAKHRERMEQRAQHGRPAGPAPFMQRES
ncbi:uncharacterized protein LOC121188698 [Toxotes jaculatrix]|uniref:uncharacterized protein LOC121188698 n=1 Tax=Toxotes jaculatrix TaxID=941984 RepID=UPI001B3B00ED|nr:uncharacterized protein LOC121188698 [Toxotes jaculatrix]